MLKAWKLILKKISEKFSEKSGRKIREVDTLCRIFASEYRTTPEQIKDRRASRKALELFQYSPGRAICQRESPAIWLAASRLKAVGHHHSKAIEQPARVAESAQGMASFLLNFINSFECKRLMMNDSNLRETNIRKSAYLCRSEERFYFAVSNKTNFKED